MKNRERYGKGKSWDVRIHEDGLYCVAVQIDAAAYKETHAITITEFQEIDRGELSRFLVELGNSLSRLAKGEVKPDFVVTENGLLEPDDEGWPF